MEWFIGISALLVLIFGSWIALWWWRLSRRIAPYRDELERERARAQGRAANENVVIVPPMHAASDRSFDATKPRP